MKLTRTILAAIFLISAIGVKAQSKDAKVTVTKTINAPAIKVWEIVKKMDDIHLYTKIVGKVEWTGEHGVGGERVCYPPEGENGGILNEKILKYDDKEKYYAYSVEGVPTVGMVNSFKVIDLGKNKSKIEWNSTYDSFVENPQMDENGLKAFLTQTLTEILDNMANAVK